MKYEPFYLFTERFYIESIVFDAFDPAMTLLVRFAEKNGISSQKHIFCQPDQLGQLLNETNEEADLVLTRLVEILGSNHMGCPEVLDVEALLGHPLTISEWRLEFYHPIVENHITGCDELDESLFVLDQVMPKLA